MTDTALAVPDQAQARPPSPRSASWAAFWALLLRDLAVLDKDLKEFLPSTLVQPVMLVFTFTYVFPRIGQGVGGSGNAARFSTLLIGGMVAQAMIFQGIFRVALPMAREFDITSELEDRVLAPTSVNVIALERIASGALQSLFAGLIVFPIAAYLPATPIYLQVHWGVLIPVAVLVSVASASLGLTIGTRIEPRLVPPLASFIALPLAFLGAIFYTWDALSSVMWLKYAVLANPLVYMSEGFRAGLSMGVAHMPVVAVEGALVAFSVIFMTLGVRGFKNRVLT